MAVSQRRKKRTINGVFGIVSKLIIIAAVIGCIISVGVTYYSVSEMETEIATIESKTQEIEAENVELQRILEDDDMNAYMEKLAIENMNYAYPDERRYYDKSRN